MRVKVTIGELADLWKLDRKVVYGLIQFLQGAGLVLSSTKRKVLGAKGPGMLEVELDIEHVIDKLETLLKLAGSKIPQPKKEK